jgi:hypothetical protein
VTAAALDLVSTSNAGDAGFLAARDLAEVARELDVAYRLVGGLSVGLLTAVHGVVDLVPGRETGDADFGADARTIGDTRLPAALAGRGYVQTHGNRFVREVSRQGGGLTLAVDLLAPSYSGHLESNVPLGALSVDAVPALGLALAMDATPVDARITLSDGETFAVRLALPDVVAALCLKAFAYRGRRADRDAVDVWRLLEAARASGVGPEAWTAAGPGVRRDAAAVLQRDFAEPTGPGVRAVRGSAGDRARVRALVRAVVGPPAAARDVSRSRRSRPGPST